MGLEYLGISPERLGLPATPGVEYGTARDVNQFMTHQAIAPFLQNMPNYANLVGKRGEITSDMLSGQLPRDVMQQIQQAGAERGVAQGSPGSSNSNAAMLRALGLNSLQMQGQGSQMMSQSIADTPVPELWNPMSLYVPTKLGQMGLSAARGGGGAGGKPPGKEGLPPGPPSIAPGPPGGSPNFMNGPRMKDPVSYEAQQAAFWALNGANVRRATEAGFRESERAKAWETANAPMDWWKRDVNQSSQWPSQASQGYWDSFEGLQNPNRPADESDSNTVYGPYNYNEYQYDSPAGPANYSPYHYDPYQYDSPAGPANYNQYQYNSPAGPQMEDYGAYSDLLDWSDASSDYSSDYSDYSSDYSDYSSDYSDYE